MPEAALVAPGASTSIEVAAYGLFGGILDVRVGSPSSGFSLTFSTVGYAPPLLLLLEAELEGVPLVADFLDFREEVLNIVVYACALPLATL